MAGSSILSWGDPKWRRAIRDRIARNMGSAMRFVAGKIQDDLSRGQPRVRRGKVMVGLDPSKPFEPPKLVTGQLKNSIGSAVVRGRNIVGFVGVRIGTRSFRSPGGHDAVPAATLELGGRSGKLKPRPYLRPAIVRHRDDILRILGAQ